jgi:hypothetical protein
MIKWANENNDVGRMMKSIGKGLRREIREREE